MIDNISKLEKLIDVYLTQDNRLLALSILEVAKELRLFNKNFILYAELELKKENEKS